MNLKILFRVLAVVLILGGLAFLVAPQAATMEGDLDPYGLFVTQQLGASTVALAVLYFLVSGIEYSPARRAGVLTVIVHQLLAGIVYLVGMLNGVVPSGSGWFGVGFSIVVILAFGYFGFIRPKPNVTQEFQT